MSRHMRLRIGPFAVAVALRCRCCRDSGRRAELHGDGAVIALLGQALEHARRLWRPVLVRPRRLLRHRRLCAGAAAGALRLNAWAALAAAIAVGAAASAPPSARSASATGLRGSYFALVTLAFAEVFRILANAAGFTGGGVGQLIKLDVRWRELPVRRAARVYVWIALALVGLAACVARAPWSARASARGSSRCARTRTPPRALGVDPLAREARRDHALGRASRPRGGASTCSFSCSSTRHRLWPVRSRSRRCWRRSSAGWARVFGPAARRAWRCTRWARHAQAVAGRCAGPRPGALRRAADADRARSCRAACRLFGRRSRGFALAGGARWLSRCFAARGRIASASAACWPSTTPRSTCREGRIVALIGPNGAGKTTLFALIAGFRSARPRAHPLRRRATSPACAPHRIARAGIARTFQIVQPFAGLSVRENIAVGAHLRQRRPRRGARRGRDGRGAGRPRRAARPAGRRPHRRRPQAAGARARAGDRAALLLLDEVLAGLNPTEIAEIVPVIRAHPRRRRHHPDDRARDAGGDEPVPSTSTCWRRAA